MINSADGTMNKATTNSYFSFFGVPYHLILQEKFQGSDITARNRFFLWEVGGGGGEGGGGGGVIFGPRIFFGFVGKPTSLC